MAQHLRLGMGESNWNGQDWLTAEKVGGKNLLQSSVSQTVTIISSQSQNLQVLGYFHSSANRGLFDVRSNL